MIAAAITPCPDCGEVSSEDYLGRGLCWTCYDRRTGKGAPPKLAAVAAGGSSQTTGYAVTWTDTKPPKLVLPPIPADTNVAGQCAWLTCVFNLNPEHPITGGVWQGALGPDGQIVLRRAGAKDLRFEPARAINTPMRLRESFVGRKAPGDGMLHPFTAEHCRQISHVIQCLCDTSEAQTEEQEAVGIVGAFLQIATAVEGMTTYGTTAQRYEAAHALRSDAEGLRYIVDANTGELVIAVGDLAERARKYVGSSLPRGWLDARMANLGWDRARLDGHAQPGRSGRSGAHATVNVYRGHLPAVTK